MTEQSRRLDKVRYIIQLNNIPGCYLLKIDLHPFCLSTTGEQERAPRFPSIDDAAKHLIQYIPPDTTDTFQVIEVYERLIFGTKANDLTERINAQRAAGIEYKTPSTAQDILRNIRGRKNVKKGGRMII